MMAGVALQSAGLYLLLVIWLFTAAQPMTAAVRRAILSAASLLVIAYLTPIVVQSILAITLNPLRYCFPDPPRVLSCEVDLKSWLKSPVSSAFVGLGIGWAFYALTRKSVSGLHPSEASVSTLNILSDDTVRLRGFSLGLLYATVLLFVYCTFQHLTGYSLLLKTRMLDEEHRMASGYFRVFGFYGHPLSLAGAALVWSSFGMYGLWYSHRKRSDKFGLGALGWGAVSVLQSALVYMSGGRTALLVLALLWALLLSAIFISLFFTRNASHNAQRINRIFAGSALLLAAAAGVVLFYFSSSIENMAGRLFTRGLGGGTLGQGPLGDRELFWQVYLAMWRDSPVLGHGYFAVEHGLRTHYYTHEGFAALNDKFNAHNIFLEVLGISGLLGFFTYLIVCVLLWINMSALAGKSQARRFILGGLGVAFLANLLHGLTQNTFFDSAVTACYLALIGLLVVPPLKAADPLS